MAPVLDFIIPEDGPNSCELLTVRFWAYTLEEAQDLAGAAGTESSLPSCFFVDEGSQYLNLKHQGRIDAECSLLQ